MTVSWNIVAERLCRIAERPRVLDEGQGRTLRWIAGRLPQQGAVLADEVGTGKTRIACAVAEAVLAESGRVAVVVPPGLMHQWSQEWTRLKPETAHKAPKRLTTFTAYVRTIVEDAARWAEPGTSGGLERAIESAFPVLGGPDLWVISHNLRAPLVRLHGDEYRHRNWQQALPSLVHSHLARGDEARDGRTRVGRIRRAVESLHEARDGEAWTVVERMAMTLADGIDGRSELARSLDELPRLDLRAGKDNRALAEAYCRGGPAQHLFERLLGRFLGEFDLIVIDEAHKSRGTVDADDTHPDKPKRHENVLTRLLERLLLPAKDSRRLGMTATPLELSGEDWEPLLLRSLQGALTIDARRAAASGADAARTLGREATQLRSVLDSGGVGTTGLTHIGPLCAAAEHMTASLRPHVTRRRRTDDELHRRFHDALLSRSHGEPKMEAPAGRPHRRVQAVVMDVLSTAQSDPVARLWSRALFAMESLAQAMRGYVKARGESDDVGGALSTWFQTAYTRLSAGHLTDDHAKEIEGFVELVPEGGESLARQRQRGRIIYWIKEQQKVIGELGRLQQDGTTLAINPLWSHPRILHAVTLIESFTTAGHKVLVFGTFRSPMRALAQVLEVRHALRALEAGSPVALSLGSHAQHAWHQLGRMRATGFDPTATLGSSCAALEKKWTEGHRQYLRLQERVKRHVRDSIPSWLATHAVDVKQIDHALRSKLALVATPFVLDAILYGAEDLRSAVDDAERVAAALRTLWLKSLLPALEDERESEEPSETEDSTAVLLAKVIDRLDDGESHAHDTHHVREMNGQTSLNTRHLLQAKFNRPFAAPHVLIAQSRVGREGLNLHESCQVVIQFNAEWNPAILEQQIGRVDRKGSRWQRLAEAWLDHGDSSSLPPFIEVRQLLFAGTYDEFQWNTVHSRQHLFDATLYGELLPAAKVANLDEATREKLARSAPDFRPPGSGAPVLPSR